MYIYSVTMTTRGRFIIMLSITIFVSVEIGSFYFHNYWCNSKLKYVHDSLWKRAFFSFKLSSSKHCDNNIRHAWNPDGFYKNFLFFLCSTKFYYLITRGEGGEGGEWRRKNFSVRAVRRNRVTRVILLARLRQHNSRPLKRLNRGE